MKYFLIACLICGFVGAIAPVSFEISAKFFYQKRGTGRREFVRLPNVTPNNYISRLTWGKIG